MNKKIKPMEILGQLGDIQQKIKQAELSFKMTQKTLEITNEIKIKMDTILIPKIEEIEKWLFIEANTSIKPKKEKK